MDSKISANDLKKEDNERHCFETAFQATLKQGGKTAEIMSYLHGEPFTQRGKNDSPDLVYICQRGKQDSKEIIVGIEHFQVSQFSKKKGASYQSIDKENYAHLKKIYREGHSELLENQKVTESTGIRLLQGMHNYAKETEGRLYNSLLSHFRYGLEKHLKSAAVYRKNLDAIADGKKIELALLIEIQTNFHTLFLNDQGVTSQVHGLIMPIFKEFVAELQKIDKKLINYIILYNESPIIPLLPQKPTVIAIRTGNVEKHLKAQNITIYEYAGEDRFQTKRPKLSAGDVIPPSKTGDDTYKVPPLQCHEDWCNIDEIFKAFRIAFYARKKGIPFAATRAIQWALYVFGDDVEKIYLENDRPKIVFKGSSTMKRNIEYLHRAEAFDQLFPFISSQNADTIPTSES